MINFFCLIDADFLDWLWELCVQGLHPGAPYQRHKTCLGWITVILDVLTYQPDRKQKKGHTPAKTEELLERARARGKLNMYCQRSTLLLLTCVLDGADEVFTNAHISIVNITTQYTLFWKHILYFLFYLFRYIYATYYKFIKLYRLECSLKL